MAPGLKTGSGALQRADWAAVLCLVAWTSSETVGSPLCVQQRVRLAGPPGWTPVGCMTGWGCLVVWRIPRLWTDLQQGVCYGGHIDDDAAGTVVQLSGWCSSVKWSVVQHKQDRITHTLKARASFTTNFPTNTFREHSHFTFIHLTRRTNSLASAYKYPPIS